MGERVERVFVDCRRRVTTGTASPRVSLEQLPTWPKPALDFVWLPKVGPHASGAMRARNELLRWMG